MQPILLFILSCILFGLALSQPQSNPAFKVTVTKHGLDYANLLVSHLLNNKLRSLYIPQIEHKLEGGGRIKIENITLNTFQEPNYDYTLIPPSTFSWSLKNAGIEVSADWWAKKRVLILLEGKGSIIANATDINITLTAKIGRNATTDNHPMIISAKCKSKIGRFSIEAKRGTLATIFNNFKDMISDHLKPVLEKQLCMRAKEFLLKDANDKLAAFPMVQSIGRELVLDHSLVADPSVANDHIEVALKGRIAPIAYPFLNAPYTPEPLTKTQLGGRMLYAWASDTIINDFLYFAHVSNMTHYLITKDTTPGAASFLKLRCNASSTCLSSAIPEVSNMFPATVDTAEIFLATSKPPTVTIKEGGPASLNVEGIMDVYAFMPNAGVPKGVKKSIAVCSLNLKADARLWIQNGRIVGQMNVSQFDMTITQSQIDEFTAMILESSIPGMITPQLEKFVNDRLAVGFEIPVTRGVALIKPEIRLLRHTVEIESDIQYLG